MPALLVIKMQPRLIKRIHTFRRLLCFGAFFILLVGIFSPSRASVQTATANSVESQLKAIDDATKSLRKIAKELDAEMNRHAELSTWNGIFGEPNMVYDEYSYYDMAPIGPGLAGNYEEGPLLPPREEILDQGMGQMDSDRKNLSGLLQAFTLPASATSACRAQWQVLQSTNTSLQTEFEQLLALLSADDYEQKDAAKLTKQLLNAASGLNEITERLTGMIKHDLR